MHMIEQVTRQTFEYDRPHKVLNIVADLQEIRVPPAGLGEAAAAAVGADLPQGGAAVGATSPPPHASPRSSSHRNSPYSRIYRIFSSIFGMSARRKDIRTLKQIAARLELEPLRSPISNGMIVCQRLRISSRQGVDNLIGLPLKLTIISYHI
jgi:hypothetical protein